MKRLNANLARGWTRLGPRFLPFADAATPELPFGRLLRLSLFQVSVGMAAVLLIGTLNRVMIVELGVPSWLVAVMVALPLLFAPLRTLIGYRSDTHRSVLGWRRVPYIWFGTLLQFGGLAIMPFALLVLSGDGDGPVVVGQVGAALAFLLLGAGFHTTQTVGLALAADLAPPAALPRVVGLLYVMLLVGMLLSALVFGAALAEFSAVRLIQVIQGAAFATMVLNLIALWKQEVRDPARTSRTQPRASFRDAWEAYRGDTRAIRRLVAIGLGTAAFSMQDILLEPYGGQVLGLSVGATTALTAALAFGGLAGFGLAARWLSRGADPFRMAAFGAIAGVIAFSAVIFAAPLDSTTLFGVGVLLIGFGAGLFAHGTLTATMAAAQPAQVGLAMGAWGAVQATAAGVAIFLSGFIRDGVSALALHGTLGATLATPATGYSVVYHLEIALLFATLAALGPLVRRDAPATAPSSTAFGTTRLAAGPYR
jgi:BCD family chlorophyll transporter-like MFS transporter